jgi:hypothetical protein
MVMIGAVKTTSPTMISAAITRMRSRGSPRVSCSRPSTRERYAEPARLAPGRARLAGLSTRGKEN